MKLLFCIVVLLLSVFFVAFFSVLVLFVLFFFFFFFSLRGMIAWTNIYVGQYMHVKIFLFCGTLFCFSCSVTSIISQLIFFSFVSQNIKLVLLLSSWFCSLHFKKTYIFLICSCHTKHCYFWTSYTLPFIHLSQLKQ